MSIQEQWSSTLTSSSSLSSSSQYKNVEQLCSSSQQQYNNCPSESNNGDEAQQSSNYSTLKELLAKQEHQLGDSNFKFIKYNPCVTLYLIVISSVLTLAVFTYMILYREQMFTFSLEFIEGMQHNHNVLITSLMNFISLCVSPKPVISLLVIFFALSTQKLKILTFLLYYGFLVYTCVILKSLFGDPRPYWINPSVEISDAQQDSIYKSRQLIKEDSSNYIHSNLSSSIIQYQNYPTLSKNQKYFLDQKQLNNKLLNEKNAKLIKNLISEEVLEPQIEKQQIQSQFYSASKQLNQDEFVKEDIIEFVNKQDDTINNDENQIQNQLLSQSLTPNQDEGEQIDQSKQHQQNVTNEQQTISPDKSNSSQLVSVLPLDWKCYQEYGNPSGHAFLGVPLYEFFVRDYILRKVGREQRLIRILIVIGTVILINLILLSRMYLGMHSLNQVIFGSVLGIYATVFYRLLFERRISSMLYKYVQLKRCYAFKQILQVCLFTLLTFSLPILIYAIKDYIVNNSTSIEAQTMQWQTIIQDKCGYFDILQSFHHKCFIDSSVVAIGFSIVLGFLLTSREPFLKGQYKEAPGIKNCLIRLFIIFACCSIIGIFYYVLPNGKNAYIKYINLFIGTFITGFLLVALVPKLFEKYSLIFIIYPLLFEENQFNKDKQFALQEPIHSSTYISKIEIPCNSLYNKQLSKS